MNLFHIPSHKIDTGGFSNLLHDPVVGIFEKEFAQYVGAKYAVALNSATSAIFLLFNEHDRSPVFLPSIIPAVVINAIINGGNAVRFVDDVNWVGHSYVLHQYSNIKVIDSAQRVDRNQFYNEASDNDVMIFSHYPTKPVGSCDGGTIVSNDKEIIEHIRMMSLNGMSYAHNNWDREQHAIGHKMYMNSIQAEIALRNLNLLEEKKKRLKQIRDKYNSAFFLNNTSDHLYRVSVFDNRTAMERLKELQVNCGIHYTAQHLSKLFSSVAHENLSLSESVAASTLSIPFHEMLNDREVDYIISCVKNELEN